MTTYSIFLVLVGAFVMLIVLMDSLIKIKQKTNLHKHFITLVSLFSIHILGLLLQILMSYHYYKHLVFHKYLVIQQMYY